MGYECVLMIIIATAESWGVGGFITVKSNVYMSVGSIRCPIVGAGMVLEVGTGAGVVLLDDGDGVVVDNVACTVADKLADAGVVDVSSELVDKGCCASVCVTCNRT